jgi:hypothetical protein
MHPNFEELVLYNETNAYIIALASTDKEVLLGSFHFLL